MAKWQNDLMLDAALTYVCNVDKVIICTSQPTTYSQANSTYKLGIASFTLATSTITSGSSSGRKLPVVKASSVAITGSGKMQHVALVDAGSTALLYVTTIPASSQASVSASDKVNMAAWSITLKDVTNP